MLNITELSEAKVGKTQIIFKFIFDRNIKFLIVVERIGLESCEEKNYKST